MRELIDPASSLQQSSPKFARTSRKTSTVRTSWVSRASDKIAFRIPSKADYIPPIRLAVPQYHSAMPNTFQKHAAECAEVPPAFQRIKHWVERRLSPRREVNMSVLVLQGTRVQTAILVNQSELGFGLSKVISIVEDAILSIAMPDGRVLEGRVVWAKEGRAGVTLMSRS
jgi:hypothetical protein